MKHVLPLPSELVCPFLVDVCDFTLAQVLIWEGFRCLGKLKPVVYGSTYLGHDVYFTSMEIGTWTTKFSALSDTHSRRPVVLHLKTEHFMANETDFLYFLFLYYTMQ
jgi:hypothetical protein